MQRDPRLELWFTTSDGAWDPASIFGPPGSAERRRAGGEARWMKFDAYVNTDFWNMTWLPRRARRIHLFHGVAGKYGLDAPTRIAPVVATFDRLMFPNRDRLTRYAEAGLVDPDGPAAALIGYPKVDCLVDGSLEPRGDPAASSVSTRRRPTVLYAPTWSPYSSLHHLRRVDHPDRWPAWACNVIVKLHDRSYDSSDRASGGVDWRTQIERVCREHGVHLAQGFDASPYLFVADALVTDHSSVGFEFMLLDRPDRRRRLPGADREGAREPGEGGAAAQRRRGRPGRRRCRAPCARGLADPSRHSARRRADRRRSCSTAPAARAHAPPLCLRAPRPARTEAVPARGAIDIPPLS